MCYHRFLTPINAKIVPVASRIKPPTPRAGVTAGFTGSCPGAVVLVSLSMSYLSATTRFLAPGRARGAHSPPSVIELSKVGTGVGVAVILLVEFPLSVALLVAFVLVAL